MRHLVAPLLAVPLLTLAPAAAHAAGTCQGQPATVEASGGTVTGTDGPDVILVTGPATVSALGGDDTVCVAGGAVDAGSGNDRVSAEGTHEQVAVLGPGDDTYVSVGLVDEVDLGEGDSAGTDTIDTGTGRTDVVGSGVAGEPNRDHVTMNAFSGGVHLRAPAGSAAVVTGGGPVTLEADDAAAYVLDLGRGTLQRDGAAVATYDATTAVVEVSGRHARFLVRGSDHRDYVSVRRAAAFRAELGGGGDSLYLYPGAPRAGRVDGGPGNDWLYARAKDTASGDLARHRLALTTHGRTSRWHVSGFGGLQVAARRIDVRGSSANESLIGFGCTVTLRGGAGKDALTVGRVQRGWPPASRCPGGATAQRGFLYGGGARDSLEGGDGPDVLVGGSGADQAIGRGGRDRCVAEVESTCER